MGRRLGLAKVCKASGESPWEHIFDGLVPEPIQIRLSDWPQILWHCIFCAQPAISIDHALFVPPSLFFSYFIPVSWLHPMNGSWFIFLLRHCENTLYGQNMWNLLSAVLRGKFWGKGAHKSQKPTNLTCTQPKSTCKELEKWSQVS